MQENGWRQIGPEILNEMGKMEQGFIDNMENRVVYSKKEFQEQCAMCESVLME